VRLLKTIWFRLTGKHGSSGATNEAFKVGSAENPASWLPSQQDRPRH
jgi:hypothetical protein